jgi:hypothetical protein
LEKIQCSIIFGRHVSNTVSLMAREPVYRDERRD